MKVSMTVAALCALFVACSQMPLGAGHSFFEDDAFVHPILHPEKYYAAGDCPQYYLIGQMKCGTTTLWHQIKLSLQWPKSKGNMFKALHTFDRHDALMQLKVDPISNSIPLDASPSYQRSLDTPLRIKNFCNFTHRPKFVVTLCPPASRTWSHFKHEEFSDQDHRMQRITKDGDRPKLNDRTVGPAYRACIEKSLPIVRSCLEKFSYQQCFRLLYGNTSPGSHGEVDSFGVGRPCTGVIFASLHTEQLEHWMSVFPEEDFMVIDRDNWLNYVPETVKAVGNHFGLSMKRGYRVKPLPEKFTNYHMLFEGVEPPRDLQEDLEDFFGARNGWMKYVSRMSSRGAHPPGDYSYPPPAPPPPPPSMILHRTILPGVILPHIMGAARPRQHVIPPR